MKKPLKVLILEDQPADVELVLHELRRHGFEPEWKVVDDEPSFRAALENPWDVILSDFTMPQFDAFRALGIVTGHSLDIPFIVVSGNIGEEVAVAAMRAGATDYLLKDRMARLGSAVDRVLKEKRLRLEKNLWQAELMRFRRAVENSGDVIFMTDRAGVFTYVNPEFTRLYGYSSEEVVGKATPRLLKGGVLRAEDYESFWRTLLREKVFKGEWANRTKDGRRVDIGASASAILDESGSIVAFLAIQRDLTEQRMLEESFRQAQKLEAIGRLAGGVAHDFNNLLTVIGGYSELLVSRLQEGDSLRQHAREIALAAERAAALTRQLLAFSRKQVLESKVVELGTVVSETRSLLSRLIGEDIEILVKLQDGGCRVKVDPGQLAQAIMNLAVNARDAMPGGGRLTIETRELTLDVAYARARPSVTPGRYAMLAVSDTGTGMDPELLSHIFEPFFTTKPVGKGTGLGLSTVFGFVKQSGGDIWVYSVPGQGTTFKIYLPLATEGIGEIAPRTPSRVVRAVSGQTVLVVEDDEAVRSLAATILEGAGYEVLAPEGIDAALEVAARHPGPIHAIVSDIVMPGMNGPQLASKVSALRPGIAVLFTSGYSDEAVVSQGLLHAGAAFLQKPFTPAGLTRKVGEVLEAGRTPDASAPMPSG